MTEDKKVEEDGALATLTKFWIPIKAFEKKKGIIYEARHSNRRIFIKYINRSRHFFRKYQAWAIDEDVLSELVDMRVEQIYLSITNEGLLMTTIENFESHSIVDEYGKHGLQAFLPEEWWEWVK